MNLYIKEIPYNFEHSRDYNSKPGSKAYHSRVTVSSEKLAGELSFLMRA